MKLLDLLRQVLEQRAERRRIQLARQLRRETQCTNGDHRSVVTDELEPHALWEVCLDCGHCVRLGGVINTSGRWWHA